MIKKTTLLAVGAALAAFATMAETRMAPALVPMPQSVRETGGVSSATNVVFERDAAIAAEGYRIVVARDRIVVTSSDDAGAFYARQTLRQLGSPTPCVEIEDAPAFMWRGILLDECRHFFGKETVKQMIDVASEHKYNVFHWHLMDDEGWRIESKAFPDLVKYGAVRPKSQCHGSDHDPKHVKYNDVPYGPFFYTHEDIRDVVAYAAERHMSVMPEVEFPAHARAALAAYPQFSCRGTIEPRTPRCIWGGEKEVFCAGNDETIRFLERLIDETCELFPFAYVHIGGDECPKDRWKECPKCQKRIRDLGLGDEEGLQKWMTQHFTRYLERKGRRAVGWDEILSAGVPKDTVVMSWRGAAGGIEAAKAGNDVIMTPNTHCYLDYRQGLREDPFQYIGGRNGRCVTLEKAYSFDPCEGIPESGRAHVLGGQANCWSEYTWNEYDLAWKTWPRACAIAEALWTAPAKPRDFTDFSRRMAVNRKRLIAAHVNCAPLE